ncbi:hypothetical protein [Micromonospora sp. NPDC049679]|uniref:hypothetical protein n=1 Tax=Micromonospora sp. NPDC049679 TaxID=3155920 RepID=UPI003403AB8E
MLPEEDRPPAWLRDYGDIEADISKMEEFAAKLDAEVRNNYGPHAESLYEDMRTEIPRPYAMFEELSSFLTVHNAAERETADFVHFYQNATGGFATAATKVSEQYRQSDAFSAARVRDIEAAFHGTAVAKPNVQGTEPATTTDRTVPDVPTDPAGVS